MITHAHHQPITRRNETTARRLGRDKQGKKKYLHWSEIWKLVFIGTGLVSLVYWLQG